MYADANYVLTSRAGELSRLLSSIFCHIAAGPLPFMWSAVWMVAVGHSTTSADSLRLEEAAGGDVSSISFLDAAALGTAVKLVSKQPSEHEFGQAIWNRC